MGYLLRGVLIGLLFGLPVGAVGAMTIQRTWNNGIKAGLFTGLGSSTADCFYAAVGVFGLTLISDFLLNHQVLINVFGGGLLLFMGIRLLLKKEEAVFQKEDAAGIWKMFVSSFAVGITNPAAILTFLFAFSYFGISTQSRLLQGIKLIGGVFIGTYVWWGMLTAATSIIKKKTGKFGFRNRNRIFGTVLCLFGAAVLLRLFLTGCADSTFTATLENNAAVDAFVEMMSGAPVIIEMSDYSGFEKVVLWEQACRPMTARLQHKQEILFYTTEIRLSSFMALIHGAIQDLER